jgi:hypothetical protein
LLQYSGSSVALVFDLLLPLYTELSSLTLPVDLPYSSPNIIRVIKSKTMRGVGHVARMRKMRNVYWTSVGKPEMEEHSGETGVDGRLIIFKWILNKWGVRV